MDVCAPPLLPWHDIDRRWRSIRFSRRSHISGTGLDPAKRSRMALPFDHGTAPPLEALYLDHSPIFATMGHTEVEIFAARGTNVLRNLETKRVRVLRNLETKRVRCRSAHQGCASRTYFR